MTTLASCRTESRQGGTSSGRRWRVLGAVAAIAAAATLASGIALAFLVVNGAGTGSASTGTVTLTTTASTTCSYPDVVNPGDLMGATTCALSTKYVGSIPAYEALTINVQSKAGSGGSTLFDGSQSSTGTGGTGLTFSVTDGHTTFAVPSGTGAPCRSPAGFTCWSSSFDLASTYAGSTPLVFNDGSTVTFTLTPKLLAAVGNGYQGGTASITLIAQAVQATSNTIDCLAGGTTPSVGQPCQAAGTFSWS